MGYFTDVKLDISDTPEGKVLTVLVKEKPAIHRDHHQRQHQCQRERSWRSWGSRAFAVASEAAIKEAINKVQKVYREKGYYEVQINYDLVPVTPDEVNLVFDVNEGGKTAHQGNQV